MPWDCQPLVAWAVSEHEPTVRVADRPGAYATAPGGGRVDLYGSADLACILYQLGALPRSAEVRAAWANELTSFQDPLTGHFVERGTPTHGPMHASAYAIGALDLLGAEPATPLRFADQLRRASAAAAFVDDLRWRDWVYLDSHDGAGLASIFHNVPALRVPSWFAAYFGALEVHLDPASGLFGDGKPPGGDLDALGGTFHYAFVYQAWNRRLPHAEARIDAVLGLEGPGGRWDEANPWWLTLDAVHLLAHGTEASGHRRADVEAAIGRVLDRLLDELGDASARSEAFGGPMGTHDLCAVAAVLAEAQRFLGIQEVVTSRPLQPVLSRRPFI